jgi:hypothetical protein
MFIIIIIIISHLWVEKILRLISFINLMTLVIIMLCYIIIDYKFCTLIVKFVCLLTLQHGVSERDTCRHLVCKW